MVSAANHVTEPLYLAIPPTNTPTDQDNITPNSPQFRFSVMLALSPIPPEYYYRTMSTYNYSNIIKIFILEHEEQFPHIFGYPTYKSYSFKNKIAIEIQFKYFQYDLLPIEL